MTIVRQRLLVCLTLANYAFARENDVRATVDYLTDMEPYEEAGAVSTEKPIFGYRKHGLKLDVKIVPADVNDSDVNEIDERFPDFPIKEIGVCVLDLSLTCVQKRIALFLDAVGHLKEITLFGRGVKLVKTRATPISDALEARGSIADGITDAIDRSVDRFFDTFALRITLPGSRGRKERNQIELMFDESNAVEGRGKKGGGNKGGGGGGGKCKKMMMMMLVMMKMKMMGMIGMAAMKGMMMGGMSLMISKAMLIMKLLEKKGGGGGGGGGPWQSGGGGGGGQLKEIVLLTKASGGGGGGGGGGGSYGPPADSYSAPPASSYGPPSGGGGGYDGGGAVGGWGRSFDEYGRELSNIHRETTIDEVALNEDTISNSNINFRDAFENEQITSTNTLHKIISNNKDDEEGEVKPHRVYAESWRNYESAKKRIIPVPNYSESENSRFYVPVQSASLEMSIPRSKN